MGIRFYCPNGHKLHVKAFQAGHRGVCPHCGAKVQIPYESTRPSSREEKAGSPQVGEETELQIEPTPQPPDMASGPGTPQPGVIPTVRPLGPTEAGYNQAPSAVPPSSPPMVTPIAPDPLDEAPEAIWYVRTPGEDQFGPASAEIMRSWLAEERIGPDYHVWREGWRDWLEAREVFPQWQETPAGPEIHAVSDTPTATMTTEAAMRRLRARRRSRSLSAVVVFFLLLVVIILAVVFFHVLQQEARPPKTGLIPTTFSTTSPPPHASMPVVLD